MVKRYNRRTGLKLILSLFLIGLLVGFFGRGSEVVYVFPGKAKPDSALKENKKEDVSETKPEQSTEILDPEKPFDFEPLEQTPPKVAVALKEKAITGHPLYPEVEKLEREILALSLEQSAYESVFRKLQPGEGSENPRAYLESQTNLALAALEKTTEELLLRKEKEMLQEKKDLFAKVEEELLEKKRELVVDFGEKIAISSEQYLREIDLLERRVKALDEQMKYSIKVDIGIQPSALKSRLENSSNSETISSVEAEISGKKAAMQKIVWDLTAKRDQKLLEIETAKRDLYEKESKLLEEKYLAKRQAILAETAETTKKMVQRRKEMLQRFSEFGFRSETQNNAIISSFREFEKERLNKIGHDKERLLERIESECKRTLEVLAKKNGYLPGGLVDVLDEKSIDLTDELLVLYH